MSFFWLTEPWSWGLLAFDIVETTEMFYLRLSHSFTSLYDGQLRFSKCELWTQFLLLVHCNNLFIKSFYLLIASFKARRKKEIRKPSSYKWDVEFISNKNHTYPIKLIKIFAATALFDPLWPVAYGSQH